MQAWLCEMYSNGVEYVHHLIVYFLIVMHVMQCLQPVISAFARLKNSLIMHLIFSQWMTFVSYLQT